MSVVPGRTGMLYVGTSGYNYSHWRGRFYPEGLPTRQWLSHYAGTFPTVELNVTFYRLPRRSTFAGWYEQTPPNFVFAIKGSRLITHLKRLAEVEDETSRFFAHAAALKEKLAVVLWQFPPSFRLDLAKLGAFCNLLKAVAGHTRHAFEFRHQSWFAPELYEFLRRLNHALCVADAPRWPSCLEATADFVYVRFHGSHRLYSSCYSTQELEAWAERIARWRAEGRDVFAYFNNDAQGFALQNARELAALLSR
ncbi:MAG: DUF72 domain-containing protein [Bacillota bacterium]